MIRTDLITPITDLLTRYAESTPKKLAFEDEARTINYTQLECETRNLATQMIAHGLKKGDSVGVWLPNSVNWVVSFLAVIRAGGVAVPISMDHKEREVIYRLRDAGISMLILKPCCIPMLNEIHAKNDLKFPKIILDDENAKGHMSLKALTSTISHDLPIENMHAVSMTLYTSGTTGQPKGVQLTTHSMLWVNASCWNPIFGLRTDDVILSPLPLYHSYALNFCVLSIIANGATAYIMERFSSNQAIRLLQSNRFSLMPGVPTMFHYMMIKAKELGINPFQNLRRCCSAGAVMPASLNMEFEQLFATELLDGYGITETSTMVTINWPNSLKPPGSCGIPLPGLAVRLIDSATGLDVQQGTEGELICRGPNVMRGYLNKPEATAQVLKDGWYHTGDLAKMDINGFLTISGRLKELIIRGGQNIAPTEVEETILQMNGVCDCAIVGIDHETLGEVPVAFIVTNEGFELDLKAVRTFCADQLSAYKLPNDLQTISEIPRTGSGKIMRFKLRDLYESGGE